MAGGLGLFLYGMTILSSGLEKASGGLMEKVLAKMTGNVFSGILFGALVTAAVQSSSATTVIVVGLVNAGLLKLKGGSQTSRATAAALLYCSFANRRIFRLYLSLSVLSS